MTIASFDERVETALGEVTVVGDSLQVVFHRRYAKPIEKVWAAVTTPERLADWLAVAEVELKPGGSIRLTWNNQHSMEGRVIACEPPRLFAWSWLIDGRDTEVRFELEPDAEGCRLTLTHSGLSPRAGPGAGVRAGWHAHLEGIREAMEDRATPWATKVAREQVLAKYYPALPA
jgi:uncharacterized protein YndB with AHSA1/START domain